MSIRVTGWIFPDGKALPGSGRRRQRNERKRIAAGEETTSGKGLEERQGVVAAIGRGLAGGHEIAGCVSDLDEEVADPP